MQHEHERDVRTLINEYRRQHGHLPLAEDPAMARIARQHSQDMADGRVPKGHSGAPERGAMMRRDGVLPPTGRWEEIIHSVHHSTRPSDVARSVVQGWIESDDHNPALVFPAHARIGVGMSTEDANGAAFVTAILGAKS